MATRDPYSRGDETRTPGTSSTNPPTSGAYGASTTGSTPSGTSSADMGTAMKDPKQAAGQVAGQAQEALGQAASKAQEQAKSALGGQLEQACSGLETMADAVRSVGQQLRQKDQAQLASFTDQAANRLEHFSGYMKDRDVDELMGDVETFARRQPMLFVGGAFFLGLMAARFLKSSRPEEMDYRRSSGMRPSYGSGYYPRGGYVDRRPGYGYQSGMGGTGYARYGSSRPGYGAAGSYGGQRYAPQTQRSNVGSGPMHSGSGTTGTSRPDMAGVGSRAGTSGTASTGTAGSGTAGSGSSSTSGQRSTSGASSPSTSPGWGTSGSSSPTSGSGTSSSSGTGSTTSPSTSSGQTTGRKPGEGSGSQGSRGSEGQ